jgi:hypothetical protein
MDFFFTLQLFSYVFLNPRFDPALDKQVVAVIHQVSAEETRDTRYNYTSDGKELHYDLAPEGGRYKVKAVTRADGFLDAVEITQWREGSRPDGDLVRYQISYKKDTLVDSVRTTRNDIVERLQSYSYDAAGRVASVKSRDPGGDSSELSLTYDLSGRGFQMAERAGSGKSFRFEFDGVGRLTERKTWDPVAEAFRTDTKLYYDASGQWTKWERFVDGQLQVVYSMDYLPRDQVLGARPRISRGRVGISGFRLALGGYNLLGRNSQR